MRSKLAEAEVEQTPLLSPRIKRLCIVSCECNDLPTCSEGFSILRVSFRGNPSVWGELGTELSSVTTTMSVTDLLVTQLGQKNALQS
jgi:hypothetical protein